MEIRNITPNQPQFNGKIDPSAKHVIENCISEINSRNHISKEDAARLDGYKDMYKNLLKYFAKLEQHTILKVVPTQKDCPEACEFVLENTLLKEGPLNFDITGGSTQNINNQSINIDFPRIGEKDKALKYGMTELGMLPYYNINFVVRLKNAINELVQKVQPNEIDDVFYNNSVGRPDGYLSKLKNGTYQTQRRFNMIADEFLHFDDVIDVPETKIKRRY